MNLRLLNFFYCLLASIAILSTSCKKDDPVPARDQFLGSYTVIETCGGGNDTYNIVVVESGAEGNAVSITNFYNVGASLNATVSGDNITIPSQVSNAITFSGSGSISGNTLTMSFSVSSGGASDNCTATCTR